MRRDHPEAHLVVGIIPVPKGQQGTGSQRHSQLALLGRLARSLRLRGTYALAAIPEREGTNVHVALEIGDDALALSAAVDATAIDRYAGWKTQRSFLFDDAAADRMRAALKVRVGRRTLKPRTQSLF